MQVKSERGGYLTMVNSQACSVVVVGHGPGLIGKGRGEEIDASDTIIRLVGGKCPSAVDYGKRADYVLTTNHQMKWLPRHNLNGVKAIWLYFTRIPYSKFSVLRQVREFCMRVVAVNELIGKWLGLYRQVHKTTAPRVDYPTKGTAAVLAAIELLRPSELCLAGFDGVMSGERSPSRIHDWRVEKALINMASDELSVNLTRF